MKRRWRRHRHSAPVEMNITAFLNLMVILVPFLLITAVFSRMAILELNLPGDDARQENQKPPQRGLEVIVRQQGIEIIDQGKEVSVIKRAEESAANNYDMRALNTLLKKIKSESPQRSMATILLEADIPFDTLVQTMDAVRVTTSPQQDRMALFPDIAIGDAPLVSDGQ